MNVLVSNVASNASSSKPSVPSKSKNKPTLDPQTVDGLVLDPPKYKRPWWNVTVLGHPFVDDHTDS